MNEQVTMTGAFNKYFGKKPGQLMSDFAKEIKEAVNATATSRDEWIAMFKTVGYDVTG